jgi:hypothetical protein
MPTVSTRPRPPAQHLSPGRLAAAGVAVVVLAVGVWAAERVFEPPATVDVTVDNPTEYDLHVQVRSRGGSVLPLGEVQAGSATTFDEVIDQGEAWVFEFSYAGAEATPLESARSELEATDWRVRIPERAAAELRRAGIEPPP